MEDGPDGGGEVFHAEFDPRSESALYRVLSAVAAVRDVEETDLTPLNDAVDPDALETVLRSGAGEREPTTVVFEYEGLEVTVRSDGHIRLRELD